MKKTYYIENTEENYNYVLEKLINQEKLTQFLIKETNYTKSVITNHFNYIFNDNGKNDMELLKLINKVKSDSNKYAKNNNIEPIKSDAIKWYYFDDFVFKNTKEHTFSGFQMDLNSAYWSLAVKRGIITNKTFAYWDETTKGKTDKERKSIRLKALGSLATVKRITMYEKGAYKELEPEYNKANRNLYLDICDSVSNLMLDIQKKVGCSYFYWDMFILQNIKQVDAINELLQTYGIKAKVIKDNFKIVKSENHNFIYSEKKNYSYPIKQEEIIYN